MWIALALSSYQFLLLRASELFVELKGGGGAQGFGPERGGIAFLREESCGAAPLVLHGVKDSPKQPA